MAKVFAKLTDPTSIFHDIAQPGNAVTGNAVAEIENTQTVAVAFRNNVLTKCTEEEFTAWKESQKPKEITQTVSATVQKVTTVQNPDATKVDQTEGAKKEALNTAVHSTASLFNGDEWTVDKLTAEMEVRGLLVPKGVKKADLIAALNSDEATKAAEKAQKEAEQK